MTAHRTAISTFLTSKGLPPTPAWLDECLSSQRAGLSLQQLQQTALFRILASDITSSVQRTTNALPATVTDSMITGQRLPGPVLVQLLDIEDIGSSSWSQVEAIEAQERGETTRGNQVIRAIPDENDETPSTTKSRGPHKLLLEDVAGTKIYAFDMKPIKDIEIGCSIGLKMSLNDVQLARGILMLQPGQVDVLGGRIDAYHNTWQDERKQRLLRKITQVPSD